ncbi:programmed cell death protein 2-like isoform X2 [Denticeps clupeoides]|uniref:MYND-type domain-containing protein n=1 Tax=Denticeps clupeoides TaxID=299321 RepID=A0A8C3ZBY5_9TELE|nr:programmed cell death protein 2-like isoform X2 [Denticeps clupeoides]XP_028852418.1 programmed cell death protein 2-like isoform X2 [Denticeps clupeoides]
MAASKQDSGVVLGFLEEPEPWRLRSPQFPSKVGGKPAWLSRTGLPTLPERTCEKCRLPAAFLLQVYAPIAGLERSFHRTLFVFCCRTPSCYAHSDSRCFKVFRSQLSRKNDFYSYEPPPDEEPVGSVDEQERISGMTLCRVCGCGGQKACSRCHSVSYCSKEHQTIDWKHRHKKECSSGSSETLDDVNSPFLFPEFELVTEPEELRSKDKELNEAELEKTGREFVHHDLDENELEDMALHETEDTKVFQKFKERTAVEPHQVLRYCRGSSPLWVSADNQPDEEKIPKCPCGAKRIFEFQVMPQLLNDLKVDSPGVSVDWGTLAVYSCADSCDQGHKYAPEFIWKQDFAADRL